MLEEWDLPRVQAWQDYCNRAPPVQAMVQAYLGIKPEPRTMGGSTELLATLQAFPGAVHKPK